MNETYGGQLIAQVPDIYRCNDGKLRWAYELSLWKNPTAFITCWKVFTLVVGIVTLILFFIMLSVDGFAGACLFVLKFFGLGMAGMTVLLFLGYSVYAFIQGGKYCVLFEMDEKGVRHIQMQKQFERAQVIAAIGAAIGAATGNYTMMGSSLLAGSRSSSYSSFSRVTKVVAKRGRHTIYVNEPGSHNQVYVSKEQFDFVFAYIACRCKKAVISPAYGQDLPAEMQTMPGNSAPHFCIQCGAELSAEAQFCPSCGAQL